MIALYPLQCPILEFLYSATLLDKFVGVDYIYVGCEMDEEIFKKGLTLIGTPSINPLFFKILHKIIYIKNPIASGNKLSSSLQNTKVCLNLIKEILPHFDCLLMNDDFFILKTPENLDVFCQPCLEPIVYRSNMYRAMHGATNRALESLIIEKPLNFCTHTPFLIEPTIAFNIINKCIENIPHLSFRQLYGNLFYRKINPTLKDVKHYSENVFLPHLYSNFLSTTDEGFNIEIRNFLLSKLK